jgi:hypothetical protein
MNLIFIYGPPAAGKLTVATELANVLGYKLGDNHRILDYVYELFPRSEPAYSAIRTKLGRKMRIDVFRAVAEANIDLIATFAPLSGNTHDFIRAVQSAVTEAGGNVLLVHLLPTHDVLRQRVVAESRKGKKVETVERWEEVVSETPTAFETFPDVEHCVIDNSELSPADTAQKIINYYNLK